MKSKKNQLKQSQIYLILDKQTLAGRSAEGLVSAIKNSPIDLIQLRDKISPKEVVLNQARRIKKILSKTNKLLIINDYLDVAKIADADGVHLGQQDLPPEIARSILGEDKIIGVSCHNRREAVAAEAAGADYIGIGPVFSTPTKPRLHPIGSKLAKKIRASSSIPCFFIGGINCNTVGELRSTKAVAVAVCSGLLESARPESIIIGLKEELG